MEPTATTTTHRAEGIHEERIPETVSLLQGLFSCQCLWANDGYSREQETVSDEGVFSNCFIQRYVDQDFSITMRMFIPVDAVPGQPCLAGAEFEVSVEDRPVFRVGKGQQPPIYEPGKWIEKLHALHGLILVEEERRQLRLSGTAATWK
ncbi:hypothetical protein MRY87_11870 [bacterium]|nr:hypothetical protein [bacterium]